MTYLNGSSVVSGVSNGLLNTYSLLANAAGGSGVTLSNINSARSNSDYATSLNQTFASFLETNFNGLDTNKDGVINPNEMTNMSNMLRMSGLTSTQLTQLGTATGLSQETISQVLAHFSDIDKNHDGRVTASEINSYNVESSKMKMQDEYRLKTASNMSMFYGNESSSNDDVSSIMSYKYINK